MVTQAFVLQYYLPQLKRHVKASLTFYSFRLLSLI